MNTDLDTSTSTSTSLNIKLPGAADAATKFQHYHSATQSMKMITTTGTPIIFVRGTVATANKEVVDYLDYEISKGLRQVQKGKLLTAVEADPMMKLRQSIIEEHEAKKAAEAAASKIAVSGSGILSSSGVTPASGSNSGVGVGASKGSDSK